MMSVSGIDNCHYVRIILHGLLLEKQSDLGLGCLSKPFLSPTSVQNFRTFTIHL